MKRVEGSIEKAVIPAAGLGSRMLPITRSIPKEMLPVGRKPMIQHVVEEAAASGLKQICIVIREGKEVIREYFDLKTSTGKSQEAMAELEALVADCESFASKVMGHVRFGFAAGCEAVAMPRRQQQIIPRATPLVRA